MSEETTEPTDDEHVHAAETLGPIDWQKWAFAVAGGIGGLIVLIFFFAAIS